MNLPPGFRFHPTDEELISHYLYKKVSNPNFSCRAIGQVDMNKSEPWDLPRKSKMGESECYFFCLRDRKYPTGIRTNRATEAGYWKATGKDKEIFRENFLIGMKKTLVFYTGRAPKGEKSNWVIHEYRLDAKFPVFNQTLKNEWVICRVFQKKSRETNVKFHGVVEKLDSSGSVLPPLEDSSGFLSSYVPCFSNSIDSTKTNQKLVGFPFPINSFSHSALTFPENSQFPASISIQEQSIKTELTEKSGLKMKKMSFSQKTDTFPEKTEEVDELKKMMAWVISDQEIIRKSFDDRVDPSTSTPSMDGPDCFLNF